MSTPSEKPPLDPILERLLQAERRRSQPSSQRLERVYDRVCATVGVPGAPQEPTGGAQKSGNGAAAGHGHSFLVKLAGLAVGGALLATIAYHAASRLYPATPPSSRRLVASPRKEPPRQIAPARPASARVAPRPGVSVPAVTAPSRLPRSAAAAPPDRRRPRGIARRPRLPRTSGPSRHGVPQSRPALPRPDRLAAERRLLDAARSALSGGQSARALEAVAAHRQRFPRGYLVEEREALSVLALVRAGREAEARAAGNLFAKRYPKSIMLEVVRDALSKLR